MAELRALCGDLGLSEVRTYIASGNLVCSSTHRSAAALRTTVERGLRSRFGFDVPAIVRTPRQLAEVVEALPFPDTEQVHVSFLPAPLPQAAVADLQSGLLGDAELVVSGAHAYLRTPAGLGQPWLRPAQAKVLSDGTVRTWRTVTALLELTRP
ncbi:MAG: DUF1697 domain-containing protein [Angustibacter sp.]